MSSKSIAARVEGGQERAVHRFVVLPAPDYCNREDDIDALVSGYRQAHDDAAAAGQEGTIPRLRRQYPLGEIHHAVGEVARITALEHVIELAHKMIDEIWPNKADAESVMRGEGD